MRTAADRMADATYVELRGEPLRPDGAARRGARAAPRASWSGSPDVRGWAAGRRCCGAAALARLRRGRRRARPDPQRHRSPPTTTRRPGEHADGRRDAPSAPRAPPGSSAPSPPGSRCRGGSTSCPTGPRWSPSATPAGCCRSTPTATSRGGRGRPEAGPQGEAGLLGVAVRPTSSGDRDVYFYVTTAEDNRSCGPSSTAAGSGRPRWSSTASRRASSTTAAGSRSAPTATSTSPPARPARASSPRTADSLAGKILRITTDGEPAPGNPDPDSPVWSLATATCRASPSTTTGRLWAWEFGDQTFDELNLIEPGANYGWPVVEGPGGGDGLRRPAGRLADLGGLTVGPGVRRRSPLDGRAARRAAVADRRAPASAPASPAVPRRATTAGSAPSLTPDGDLWVTTSNRDGRGPGRRGRPHPASSTP